MTGRGSIARKATVERVTVRKMIAITTVRKTTAMMTTIGKAIIAVVTVGKAIVAISGNGMIVNDTGTIPTTNRLASTDKITGSLATIRSGRPMLSATRTTPLTPILTMKMTLIPLPIYQSPPFMAI